MNVEVRHNTIRIITMKLLQHYPKKWIRDHKQHKSDMTIHYDTIIKPIFKIGIIPPNKPLWLLILYLIHQERNYLWNLQHRF
jgi:hypothetical protein